MTDVLTDEEFDKVVLRVSTASQEHKDSFTGNWLRRRVLETSVPDLIASHRLLQQRVTELERAVTDYRLEGSGD